MSWLVRVDRFDKNVFDLPAVARKDGVGRARAHAHVFGMRRMTELSETMPARWSSRAVLCKSRRCVLALGRLRSGRLAKPQSQRKAFRSCFVVNMVWEFGNWRLSSLLRIGILEEAGWRVGWVLCHRWREDP